MGRMKSDWMDDARHPRPVIDLKDDNYSPSGSVEGLSDDEASDIIVDWFLHFYADPTHEMPYDSQEGGYQFIYGGPYDATEVLEDAFDTLASDQAISLAVDKINDTYDVWEWAPSPLHPDQVDAAKDYDQWFSDDYWKDENDPLYVFNQSTRSIELAAKTISETKIHEVLFNQMLFARAFSLLEAFLFDRLKKLLSENADALLNFSQNDQKLSNIKFSAEQILAGKVDVRKSALGLIEKRIFHRFDDVLEDYKSAIGFDRVKPEFEAALISLKDFLILRHDCVHRGGKNLAGEKVTITREEILEVIRLSTELTDEIQRQCAEFEMETMPF